MRTFRYFLPANDLVFGKGTIECVGAEIRKIGKKVMLVTGKRSMEKIGFLQKIIALLKKEDLEVIHYGQVEPNPTIELVDRGAKEAIKKECEVIVGLGGGSAMDTAKGIAVVAGHSKDGEISIWDFAGVQERPLPITSKTLPIVAITSTSGTGSHVSRFAVVTNKITREKIGIMSPFICPGLCIVDIDILSCMPSFLTARTGFDALSHVLECFISKKANPVTDIFCLKAMELIFTYLPQACANDEKSREAMAIADTLAGWALVTSRPVLPHALSHPVSAFYPTVDHGAVLAALTPEIMRFNIERADQQTVRKFCQIVERGKEEGGSCDRKKALRSVDIVNKLIEKIELNVGLGDFGVSESNFEAMAESAFATMKGPIEANPVSVEIKDIVDLYRQAM